ncbi:sporulation protein [Actinocorallia sp. B10E7]|uniref:sporulation protein n=1 Tax=Actinocorallia sp. B10E7 TaxID=3153558 RepID=UPI00325E462D
MGFRTFFSTLGANAPQVETVLDTDSLRPGDRLTATVTAQGGGADVQVEGLTIELVTRVEQNEAGSEVGWSNPGVVASFSFPGFSLPQDGTVVQKVACDLPWETPITHVSGRPLRGARAAVRTVLEIEGAVDRGDFDEIAVHALPAQSAFVEGLTGLGFRLDEAEVKLGRVNGGTNQTLDHWQELEAFFPADYNLPPRAHLEIVFIARPDSLDLITGSLGPFPFDYADVDVPTAARWLDQHLRSNFQR